MTRKWWSKRIVATFLSFGMVLTSFCSSLGTAYADEVSIKKEAGVESIRLRGTDASVASASNVAEVKGMGYATLQKAIDAATDGDTVKLIADDDIDISQTGLSINKNITLDLNGRTIKAANTSSGNIKSWQKFTLDDSAGGGRIYSETDYIGGDTANPVISINAGIFTMKNGEIYTVREDTVNKGQYGISVRADAKAVIEGGRIESGWYAILGHGTDLDGTEIVIKGGELFSEADYVIYHPQAGTVTIEGGTISGGSGAVQLNRGTLNVEAGTLTCVGDGDTGEWSDGTGGTPPSVIYAEAEYGDVQVNVKGGDFNIELGGDVPIFGVGTEHNADIQVSGGTYTKEPDDKYIVSGYATEQESDRYKVAKISITLDKDTLSMNVGDTNALTATYFPTGKAPVWTSSNAAIATVDEEGNVTAVAKGEATITATIDENISASCKVKVSEEVVEVKAEIKLDKTNLSIVEGETGSLIATTTPAGETVTWKSSDETVAKVDSNGKITAVTAGTATITATVTGGNSATCEVTVTAKPAAENPDIKLSQTESTLYLGETLALKAENVPETVEVTWSANADNVSVDKNGVVTALIRGSKIVVTASAEGYKPASCTITVKEQTMSQNELALTVGNSAKLSLNPAFAAAEWKSSNPEVATVDENGVVHAVSAGTTTIRAYINNAKLRRGCNVIVTAAAGSVGAVEGTLEIDGTIGESILQKTDIPENADSDAVYYGINNILTSIGDSTTANEASESLAAAATGVKAELTDGQNATVYVKTNLKDLQVKVVVRGEGDAAETIVIPEKIVYEANAFRKIYAKDGKLVKDEEKVGNDKLSKNKFAIRFPIPVSVDKKYAKVVHIAEDSTKDTYHVAIKSLEGEKYIELSIRHFSTFEVTFEDSIPSSGGSSSGGGSGSGGSSYRHVDASTTGKWIQDAKGWKYQYSNGIWQGQGWVELTWNKKSDWYYFESDGYMKAGWLLDGGRWYYLHAVPDGTQGHMYTGWHEIGGKWYYFSTITGGPKGAMASSVITPDGYRVGADGAWIIE